MISCMNFNNIKVYDNFLEQEELSEIFEYMNDTSYMFRQALGEWNKVWNLSDGQILMGQEIVWPFKKMPPIVKETEALEPFIRKINETIESSELFDVSRITKISLTPYCWPPGTGLSWHNDSNYLGAFTFYCHNYWSPEWGGEFMTLEANEYIELDKKKIPWKVFDNQELYNLLMEGGSGNFFHSKPNRLILNKGGDKGILHKVAKTTTDSKPRLTLQGFIHTY